MPRPRRTPTSPVRRPPAPPAPLPPLHHSSRRGRPPAGHSAAVREPGPAAAGLTKCVRACGEAARLAASARAAGPQRSGVVMCTRACAAAHAAHAARADEGWSGLRVSYGLCGIVIMDHDVLAVADYLWRHQARPARQNPRRRGAASPSPREAAAAAAAAAAGL